LVNLIPPVAVRLRRDTKLLLNLIRAHALLQQARREQDGQGRILATLDDYAAIHGLVDDYISEGIQASASAAMRQTVGAVAQIARESCSASLVEIANALKVDKSSASRRCRSAESRGYIRNEEPIRGKPARYVIGDPLPAEQPVLPHPKTLAFLIAAAGHGPERCSVAGETEGYVPLPPPSSV